MKTVQMTFDEKLLKSVDKMAKQMGTSRSAFTRDALNLALKYFKTKALEKKHFLGYSKSPVQPDEFSDWEDEQKWID